MIILNPGYSVTLTLIDNDTLTVNARGSVLVEALSGLGVTAGAIATASGQHTYGPYLAGQIRITASGGDCGYSVEATSNTATLSRDSSGNVTGLVVNGSARYMAYVLAQSAVPVILVPNGTVATNGTITLGTALPTIYSGGAWIRLPAGAVVGGLAGLYWCVFSSTTVGVVKTLFADPATAFIPYVQTVALVTATGSNAAYTQTTGADITLANITIPSGVMGLNGALRYSIAVSQNNSVGTKTIKAFFGGVSGKLLDISTTTSVSANVNKLLRSRGSLSSQLGDATAASGTGYSFALNLLTINHAVDQQFTVAAKLDTATDYEIVDALLLEVIPS